MREPEEAGAAASRREESAAERAAVILTSDQRVRVYISSTLEELAQEPKSNDDRRYLEYCVAVSSINWIVNDLKAEDQ